VRPAGDNSVAESLRSRCGLTGRQQIHAALGERVESMYIGHVWFHICL
jgi:hypothetical protein